MFKNLKLSTKIIFGCFASASIIAVLVIAVSIVLQKAVTMSVEYTAGNEVFAELDDAILGFESFAGSYVYSRDDEFYDQIIELEEDFHKTKVKEVYDVLGVSPNPDFKALSGDVANIIKEFESSMKLLRLVNENFKEIKRLHEEVILKNSDNASKQIEELKSMFAFSTREWSAVSEIENLFLSTQLNYWITVDDAEATAEVVSLAESTLEELGNFGDYNISSKAKQIVEKLETSLKNYVSAVELIIVEYSKTSKLCEEFMESKDLTVETSGNFYYGSVEAAKKNSDEVSQLMNISILTLLIGLFVSMLITFIFVKTTVLKATVKHIGAVIDGISNGANHVETASKEISSAAEKMAQDVSTQTGGLSNISSSLVKITDMAKQTVDNARNADHLVQDSAGKTKESQKAMSRLESAVVEIQNRSNETAKIIKDIDEIAFQTNLLALNAAVEAARAGEAGKGFAVVAEEVRNLAQRSAESAKKTAELLEESQKSSLQGVNLAKETADVIEKITLSSNKIAAIVSEIRNAAEEQANGVSQISSSVNDIESIMQSNASSSEELAAASQDLGSQAVLMNDLVGDLVGVVNGESARIARAKKHNQDTSILREPSVTKRIAIVRSMQKGPNEALIPFNDDD